LRRSKHYARERLRLKIRAKSATPFDFVDKYIILAYTGLAINLFMPEPPAKFSLAGMSSKGWNPMGIELLSQVWPEWKVEGQIGESGFAKVYKASKTVGLSTELAAIKTMPGKDDSWLKVADLLKGCPYVLVPDESAKVGDELFVREELLIPWRQSLPPEELIKACIDVLCALEECAKRNILHRDVKPSNIFRTVSGSYRLGDFNVACFGSGKKAIGTSAYMAPEALRGSSCGITADLYSLGMTLYYGLNYPMDISRDELLKKRMSGERLPMHANVSFNLEEILRKACAFNPKDRYQTPTEFKEALIKARRENITELDDSFSDKSQSDDIDGIEDFTTDPISTVIDDITTSDHSFYGYTHEIHPVAKEAPQAFPLKRKIALIAGVALAVLGVLAAALLIFKKLSGKSDCE
jgi:serine/threonine protein kinase